MNQENQRNDIIQLRDNKTIEEKQATSNKWKSIHTN